MPYTSDDLLSDYKTTSEFSGRAEKLTAKLGAKRAIAPEGSSSSTGMVGNTIAMAKEGLGEAADFVSGGIDKAREIGGELNKRSWATAGARQLGERILPRVIAPWMDWDKQDRRHYLENYMDEYDIPLRQQREFVNSGIMPSVVTQGEKLRKEREEAAIEAEGGMLPMLANYIAENPKEFGKELLMGIAADPELLGLGSIYKSVFASLAKSVPKAAQVSLAAEGVAAAGKGLPAPVAHAGAIAAESAAGAALVGGGEAVHSLEATGEVDMSRVKTGAAMGGAAGAFIGTGQAVFNAVARAGRIVEAKASIQSEHVQAAIYLYAEKNKVSIDVAAQRILERYGVNPTEISDELQGAIGKLVDELPDGAAMGRTKEGGMPSTMAARDQAKQVDYAAEAQGAQQRLGPLVERVAQGEQEAARGRPPTPTTGPVRDAEVYPASGGGVSQKRIDAAQAGRPVGPAPVTRAGGYGLVEEQYPPISPWSAEGKEPKTVDGAALAADLERIAWKERSAAAGASMGEKTSPIEPMFTSSAYKPNSGTVTKPILTLDEFAESSMGRSASGNKLQGAPLIARWKQFHKEMVESNKDPSMRITQRELEDIMSETSPVMKKFFMNAGRKAGTRENQIPAKFRGQQGSVSPQLVTITGAVGMAALIGYGAAGDWRDSVRYAIIAGGGLAFGGKILRGMAKKWPVTDHLIKGKRGVDLDDIANKFQGEGAVYERKLRQQHDAMKLVSGDTGSLSKIKANVDAKKLRERVTDALEDASGKLYKALPDNGKELYHMTKQIFADAAALGAKRGILSDTLENYVPHVYQHATKNSEEVLAQLFGDVSKRAAMDTIHRKTRVIPTYAVASKLGLVPRTKDIAELTTMYLKAMDQAHRANMVMSTLKKTKSPLDNLHVILPYNKAPAKYVNISHPKFSGVKVHPDIAPAMKSMFGGSDFNAMVRGALGINFLLKRQAVSLSGFHAKALLFSQLMAGGLSQGIRHPISSSKDLMMMFKGKSIALQAFKDGNDTAMGRKIDTGLRNGLVLNITDDVGKDTFYEFMDDMVGAAGRAYDKVSHVFGGGVVGKTIASPVKAGQYAIRGLENMNKIVDGLMWDRIYTGLKLTTYLRKMETLSAKFGDKIPENELSAMAAEYVNDAFGGLNWTRLAQNVENKYASSLAHSMASRGGRAVMQGSMFAPDWTISQIRIFYKAFANKNPVQRELYQRYQFTGLLMFLVGADGINLAMSGKHIWENKDVSTIDIGGGRRLSLSKQYYEPAKWAWHPQQSALNKMSTIARTGLELGMGEKYLRYGGTAPPIENNLTHILGKAVPIWAANGRELGVGAGAASAAGFPVYGKPIEAKSRYGARSGGTRKMETR